MGKKAKSVSRNKKRKKKTIYSHIVVDLYATSLHRHKLSIKGRETRTSKSRQWTKDSKIIGDVKKDGDDYGKLALRENPWDEEDPFQKKFIMKLFTAGDYWRGTIETLLGESVKISQTTNEICPAFICVLSGTSNIVRIKKLPHTSWRRGDVYGFDLLSDDSIHQSYTIDDKRLTIGSDWWVKNIKDEKLAKIDGKWNIGGKFNVSIYDQELAKNKFFINAVILFASSIRFHKEIVRTAKELVEALKYEDGELKLQKNEAELYLNPRKL